MGDTILMPRYAGKFIADNSKDVKISTSGISQTAKQILELIKTKKEIVQVERWSQHELNPKTADQKAVDWVFLTDVLNFSFWSEDENKKYIKEYNGNKWTGYWSLCAAIDQALDNGIPITDPKYFATVSKEKLNELFKSDSDYTMPMLDERIQNLHEAGKVLVEKYDGTFVNVIKASNKSAQKLIELVIEDFPSFRDMSEFEGKTVAIYKRVQILVADIWAACGGKGHGEFRDIDTVTMFADYRIPQALVWFKILEYSEDLTDLLCKKTMMKSGDRLEVEIRGCSIWAVELLVEEMKKMIASDPDLPNDMQMNAILVDHFMWDYRREHAKETDEIPFHRIRCIYY